MPRIKIGYAEDYAGATHKYKMLGKLENQDVLAVQWIIGNKPYFLTGWVELRHGPEIHDIKEEEA